MARPEDINCKTLWLSVLPYSRADSTTYLTKTEYTVTCRTYGVPRGSREPIRFDPYFKNTGPPVKIRPVNLQLDPYFRYGSTHKSTRRPVNILVDPYFTGRPVYLRVDPYFTGLLAFTGRPANMRVDPQIYGSTRILNI